MAGKYWDGLRWQSVAGFNLVWKNQNPTINFGAQTLQIDLSRYSFILAVVRFGTSANSVSSMIIPKGEYGIINMRTASSSDVHIRGFTPTDTGVEITNGFNNTSANSAVAIPVAIYGI